MILSIISLPLRHEFRAVAKKEDLTQRTQWDR
jgi:hypothetical protein